jgi:regulator of cell morphogenesis and NO signaling
MMNDFDRTVSEIVKIDYRTAEVFKKWQLNFCCGGQMNLKSLCEVKDLGFNEVVEDLKVATRDFKIPSQIPFQKWKIDFLIEFIVQVHHDYIYQVMPPLKTALDAFALTHTHKFPELSETTELISKLSEKLIRHNRHEDEIIFPYIKQIYTAFKRKEPYGNLFVRTLRKPLHNVEQEQLEIDELLNGLRQNTNNFNPPLKSCASYQVLISKMEELYENQIQHQFFERNVLFPQAIEIEQKLLLM